MIILRKEPANLEPPMATTIAAGLPFSILNWCAWTPNRETRNAWCEWAGVGSCSSNVLPPSNLPMMLRRRLSPFGQRLVSVVSACAQDLPPPRYVLSTRHGELSRALNILEDIEAETLPSPTDFSMSIHHALLGLLSIHSDNRLGHTALSAGWDSFGAGLLEAATCVAERPNEPVILVHADEPLPESYRAFREADDAGMPLIVAFALGSPTGAASHDISLQLVPHAGGEQSASMATDFLRFFLANAPSGRAVGRRSDWVWRRGH